MSSAENEVAWLIEFTPFPQPLYWTGSKSFDSDHMKAVRFSRRGDAERVLEFLLGLRPRALHAADCYRVTEHMWCANSKVPPPNTDHELHELRTRVRELEAGQFNAMLCLRFDDPEGAQVSLRDSLRG